MNEIKLGTDINILQIGNDYQTAGLVFTGPDKSFLVSLPHKHDDVIEPIFHLKLDDNGLKEFLYQLDTLGTEVLTRGEDGDLVKQVIRKTQRQIDGVMQWVVFKRDNYSCRYCGRDGIPLSVDHVILWEEGGPTIVDNLLTACKSCNRDRGSIHFDEWLNSPIYARKSKNLPEEVKRANMLVAMDLPRLSSMKVLHVRSR